MSSSGKKRGKKTPEKKKNKFTEIFEEEEKKEKRRADPDADHDDSDDDKKKDEDDEDRGVALFDLDVYGRKVGGHAAGFGRGKAKKGPGGFDEELSESEEEELDVEEEDDEEESEGEEEDLEEALFDEWDMMALERARRAVDDGYGYFWDSLEGSKAPKAGSANPTLLPRFFPRNRKLSGALRRRVLYSPGFYLGPGQYKSLHAPLPVWPHKTLPISYGELGNFSINIDMWNISEYTFNTLYASTTLSLREIVDMDPDVTLMLQRSLPNKKKSYEIQRIKASIQISEVFDFDLYFESWSFTPNRTIVPYVANLPKILKFILPKGSGKGWKIKWTEPQINPFWPVPFTFIYRGTMQQLQNAYFIVKVYVKTSDHWYSRPALLGTALMSLRSVATYPLFKSMVKQLTTEEIRFDQGELIGNIRCFTRSTGLPYYEDPATVKRPEQPLAGAALVTQLDFKEQFLVIRLFKCENLPATNSDAGTSDPVVKVMWDGMTNQTVCRPGTLRPVYNQNLYFPIRLLDPNERTVEAYIKNCLPLDILSKGNVIFEVWDKDETSSDFLGGCELHLSDLYRKGKKMTRILAEGLGSGDQDAARLPDGRPAAFQYKGEEDHEAPAEMMADDLTPGITQPYEVSYTTHVYMGNGVELTGATVAASAVNKPMIFFEVFVIPPLPEELELPAPRPIKEEQDLWKQWSKRWDRDFSKWLRVYMEWFPEAPTPRRFLCIAEHPQTRHLHPLPAFVTPVAVPEQIQEEGELLHWICNMTFLYSSKQMRTGELPRWLSPNYFLITRKGGINDHAILLCSCLLGLDYDAYVCKGTINGGRDEHCWVMTRHEDGWVVFWDLTNKKRYHLPARWGYPMTNQLPPPPTGPRPDVKQSENPYYSGDYLSSWLSEAAAQCGVTLEEAAIETAGLAEIYGEDVVPDIVLSDADIELETWEKQEKSTQRKGRTEEAVDFDRMRQWMEHQIDVIPIAPKKALIDPESTLAYVPYTSIEVLFNNEQLWGNLQNHHPACISYDLEDEWMWRTFLTERPKPIDHTIFVAPSTRDKACEILQDEIQADIAENIRVYRQRRGLETQLDHGEAKTERLDKYLDLLEFRMRLDPDYDPGPPPGHDAWSAWGTFESIENTQDYSTEWYSHLQKDPAQLTLYGQDQTEVPADSPQGDKLEQQFLEVSRPIDTPAEGTYQPQVMALKPASEMQSAYGHQAGGPRFAQEAVHGIVCNQNSSSDKEEENFDKQDFIKQESPVFLAVRRDSDALSPTETSSSMITSIELQEQVVTAAATQVPVVDRQIDSVVVPIEASKSFNEDTSEVLLPTPTLCRAISRLPEGKTIESILTPATFGSSKNIKGTRWGGFSDESEEEEELVLNGSDTDSDPEHDAASVLEYCERKKVRLATTIMPTPRSPPLGDMSPVPKISFEDSPLLNPSGPPKTEKFNPPPKPLEVSAPKSPIVLSPSQDNQSHLLHTDGSLESNSELSISSSIAVATSLSTPTAPVLQTAEVHGTTGSPCQSSNSYSSLSSHWPRFLMSALKPEKHQPQDVFVAFGKPTDLEYGVIGNDHASDNYESLKDIENDDNNVLSNNSTTNLYESESRLSVDTVDMDVSKNFNFPPRISSTVRQLADTPKEEDLLWEEFESAFNEFHARFYPTIEHTMMMDDYEAFEQKQKARAQGGLPPPAGFSPTAPGGFGGQPQASYSQQPSPYQQQTPFEGQSQPSPFSPPKAAADDQFYKMLQRPVVEEQTEDKGGLDISSLGFNRDEALGERAAAVRKPPKKKERGKEESSQIPEKPSVESLEVEAVSDASKISTAAEPVERKPGEPLPPPIYRRPVLKGDYPNNQMAKWNYYYRMEGLFYQWQKARFPVRPSHTFCGFPLHFSTTDTSHVRSFLLASRRFRKVMEIPVDGITYVIRCKVFPLMGGVVSVWAFIGCEIHWAGKRERQTKMKRAPKKGKRQKK